MGKINGRVGSAIIVIGLSYGAIFKSGGRILSFLKADRIHIGHRVSRSRMLKAEMGKGP